ncbi:MAG: UDP-3-O-acyl-N-acetylglucosamine deacetylase [Saprospiraceae bacterium]|nr:UDP-3-O-acyl-N-acetylglucosamine deacetylase [Candidatus Vicinibacter affinis]
MEHTLFVLTGMEIDNVMIELDGPEIPLADGSSIQFVQAIEKVESRTGSGQGLFHHQ